MGLKEMVFGANARREPAVSEPGQAPDTSSRDVRVPEKVTEHVLVDSTKGVVYVDRNHSHDPEIRTWIHRRTRESDLITEEVDATEMAVLKAKARADSSSAVLDDEENRFKSRVKDMLYRAARNGASDVHIQVRQSDTVVHFVVDGESRLAESLTQHEGSRALKTIYQGIAPTSDSSYLPRENQNAQIPGDAFPAESGLTSIRVVKGPCYPQEQNGEFMTLRMQYSGGSRRHGESEKLPYPPKPEGQYRLPSMGFDAKQIEALDELMAVPEGLILFVGPTGSGKTTSIYEFLSEMTRRKPYKRVITVEDPVEIPIPTAVQMSVTNAQDKESTARAYQSAVRTMLRMAPKVILIGELRDEDVAALAMEAAVTGHTVVTTLHVDEAFQWVDRLETMGTGKLKRQAFCDPKRVRGVITQRILSHVCPHCAKRLSELPDVPRSHRLAVEALTTWGDISNVRLRGDGCERCQGSGVAGRYAIAEVIKTDRNLMRDFVEHGTVIARQNYQARPDSEKPMIERAIAMVLNGSVDPVTVEDNIDVIPKRERASQKPHVVGGTGAKQPDDRLAASILGVGA
jgi:general secretion pathway protein E